MIQHQICQNLQKVKEKYSYKFTRHTPLWAIMSSTMVNFTFYLTHYSYKRYTIERLISSVCKLCKLPAGSTVGALYPKRVELIEIINKIFIVASSWMFILLLLLQHTQMNSLLIL